MLHTDCVPDPVLKLLRALVTTEVMERFALGGGTSLALRYGHRISVDLDFFTTDPFDPECLVAAPELTASRQINRAENSLTLEVDGVKVDILRHAYPLLSPEENVDGIALLSVADVSAMKINAVINRGSKKDFYDLHRLLQDFELAQLLDWFESKYPQSNRFLALKSLTWFQDAESEPDPVSRSGPDWEQIKGSLRRQVAGADEP